MNITIHDDAKKILSSDEYKYLLLLEFNDEFGEKVEEIKKRLEVTAVNGIVDQAALHDETLELVQKLNIPVRLFPSISDLIQWGQVLSPNLSIQVMPVGSNLDREKLYNSQLRPPPSRLEEKFFWENWYKSNQRIISETGRIEPILPLIKIYRKFSSVTEFKKEIHRVWPEIKRAMEDFEKSLPIPIHVKRMSIKELELSTKIYRLRKKGVSYKKIYDKLGEEIYKHLGKDYSDAEKELIRKHGRFHEFLLNIGFVSKQ